MYTVEYFIKKFEAIDNWRTGGLGTNSTPRCVLGHCNVASYSTHTLESHALGKIFKNYFDSIEPSLDILWKINDGHNIILMCGDFICSEKYGLTPKERILNVLKEIRAKELETRVEHHYHVIEVNSQITKEAKELISHHS